MTIQEQMIISDLKIEVRDRNKLL